MAAQHLRVHARPRLRRLDRARARARRVPDVQRRPVPLGRQLRLAPAGRRSRTRSASTASATRTCSRSRPPAPSASPSPTTRRNGIEPPFSWTYTRKKRMADGTHKEFRVEDHAWRLYRHLHRRRTRSCPTYFVTALEISADAHQADGRRRGALHRHQHLEDRERARGLSVRGVRGPLHRGVEVGAEGPRDLSPQQRCWARCSRPTAATGAKPPQRPLTRTAPTAAWRSRRCPQPVLASLRWPGRPELPAGNLAWTYMIDAPTGALRALRRATSRRTGRAFPFEVWVNGAEQPRGLGAVAKTLSMDMRANDRAWLAHEARRRSRNTVGRRRVRDALPAARREAARARRGLRRWRRWSAGAASSCSAFDGTGPTPVLDHMFSVEEPRTGTDGTLVVDGGHLATRPRATSSCWA